MLLSVISVAWASTQTNERLRQLDESLARRDFYEQQRVKRINELRDGLRLAKAEGRQFEQLMKLYEENKSYCYDSARHYAYACLEVAQLETLSTCPLETLSVHFVQKLTSSQSRNQNQLQHQL